MIDRDTAQTALEAVWACMVELAEHGHDFFVLSQAAPGSNVASQGALIADRLAILVKAAILLAEIAAEGPEPDPP